MKRKITEYQIIFNDGEEFISENKKEADKEFKQANKNNIHQYFRKDWILVDGDYQEDFVEVYYYG